MATARSSTVEAKGYPSQECPSCFSHIYFLLRSNARLLAFLALFFAVPLLIFLPVILSNPSTPVSGPYAPVGFQHGPSTRGTMSIIYMCLSAKLVVAYAATDDDEHVSRRSSYDSARPPFSHHLGKTATGFLFPELLLFQAVIDFLDAFLIRARLMHNKVTKNGQAIGFFAVMMGFTNEGRILDVGAFQHIAVEHADRYDWDAIRAKIRAVGRYDPYVKATTICQLIWVFVQTFGRVAGSMPISALEVTTCAHIMCGVLTYIFWSKKPYDVRGFIALDEHRKLISEEKAELGSGDSSILVTTEIIRSQPQVTIHQYALTARRLTDTVSGYRRILRTSTASRNEMESSGESFGR